MYSEEQWDRRWRIRTCGRDTQAEDAHHRPYEPTPYAVLDRLADSGLIGRDNTLLDYGCGKGRAALLLSHRTGCKSVGIDFNPALITAAEENRASFAGHADTVFCCADAGRYEIPGEADRFYFFNPFSAEILRAAVSRIVGSWYSQPRPMLLFFYYPSDEAVRFFAAEAMLCPVREIDCSDLFPGDGRERLLVYSVGS